MATKTAEHGKYSLGGGDVVDHDEPIDQTDIEDPESFEKVDPKDPTQRWVFWSEQIQAALNNESRFRDEGYDAEVAYFGEDTAKYQDKEYKAKENQTNIIHANIEVLKPLIFSDLPEAIVRRRFHGDGAEKDPTDRICALVAQRLADYLIETTNFESAMEQARDDWLVPGRGTVRVMYHAKFKTQPVKGVDGQPVIGEDGQPMIEEVKDKENVKVRHWPWPRALYGAADSWDEVPFMAFETPMTKQEVKDRFDGELVDGKLPISELTSYPINGLKGNQRDKMSDEMVGWEPDKDSETSNTKSVSAHDQCIVFEIWDKRSKKVFWWSPHYRDDIMDESEDPLGLENFFNSPKPLLSVTKNGSLTPRPEIAFYISRAEEIDKATDKLSKILNAISVSGLYPGSMVDEMKKLLDGKNNKMVAVENWTALLEKGGTGSNGIIQWLPIDMFVKAAQALAMMREQSKQALYEISGISDIIRGQSDPNETLGAQQIKGNYANIRLRDKQRKMQRFARETIQIMVELALEHFDTDTIREIVNLELPLTDEQLQQLNAKIQQGEQMYAAAVQQAQATGQQPPPKPKVPFFEQTSWERVHGVLRQDMTRKFAISIETDGTILQDQEEDKRQRVEFLQAFTGMVDSLFPMAQSGAVEMKIIKELLLFAVRGFPKSRTLEGMISSLPDDINTEPPEDTAVTVAKIKAAADEKLAKFGAMVDMQRDAKEQSHELRLKGAEMIADAMMEAGKPTPQSRQ